MQRRCHRISVSAFRRPILPYDLCNRRKFTVLALESSADDTAAAVVTSDRRILSNVVVKQHDLHTQFGGIHPSVAIEGHQRNMPGAVRRALSDAGMNVTDVDGIAYTRGPGIGGCLSVGSNAAKSLAAALNKPLVGVHHMQAHALTPLLTTPPPLTPSFPFLTLLISGGHTLLLLATSPTHFQTLATTADESIGRAFDKVARLLGVPWGPKGLGASLEEFCAQGDLTGEGEKSESIPELPTFPIPSRGKLMFSYTCLHSTIERYLATHFPPSSLSDPLPRSKTVYDSLDTSTRLALARGFQRAAIGQLEEKFTLALRWCARKGVEVRSVVVSGGVASNLFLRDRLGQCVKTASPDSERPIGLLFPPPELCTDNAVMIAWASMHRFLSGDTDDYTIELRPKWNIEDLAVGR